MNSSKGNVIESPMRGAAVSGERLENQVYARLLDLIRLGHYPLGQKLPSEHKLAAEQRVSRPVLRTALARLREDGLIVSRRGAGSFVSSGTPLEGTNFGALESVEDIARYFSFRRLIEGETTALAALKASERDVAELRKLIVESGKLIDRGTATIELDIQFHVRIAELSDNRFLSETVKMLRPQWMFVGKFVRSLAQTGYSKGKRHMNDEHSEIVAAFDAGDGSAARDAMLAHIDGSERRVFKGEYNWE